MRMYNLSDDDVRKIATDIFAAKKITNIHRNKRKDTVSCTIHTEWECGKEVDLIADKVTFRDPFSNSLYEAIEVEDYSFPLDTNDLIVLRQFCYAKGINPLPEYLTKNNPYLCSN